MPVFSEIISESDPIQFQGEHGDDLSLSLLVINPFCYELLVLQPTHVISYLFLLYVQQLQPPTSEPSCQIPA